MLSSRDLEKLQAKQSELAALSGSDNAEKLRKCVDKDALQKALDTGDTQSVSKAVAQILSTKEGAELFRNLENLLK